MVFQKKRIAIMLFFTAFCFYLFYVLGTVELSLTVAVLEIGMGIVVVSLVSAWLMQKYNNIIAPALFQFLQYIITILVFYYFVI